MDVLLHWQEHTLSLNRNLPMTDAMELNYHFSPAHET
jgi:hypothetical protein